jgi:hypothetical protein
MMSDHNLISNPRGSFRVEWLVLLAGAVVLVFALRSNYKNHNPEAPPVPAYRDHTIGPCAADAKQFCPGLKGGGALDMCLQVHRHELSGNCQDNPCGQEVKSLCKVRPEFQIECLKGHWELLSESCKGVVQLHIQREAEEKSTH